jgi:uncharacterized protein YegP (UPF0339 family)
MTFEIFYDKKGKPRFRLRARNNKIVNQSESYANTRNAKRTIASIVRDIQDGNVKVKIEVK